MLLAVDIGGTETKCALFEAEKNAFSLRDVEKYESEGVTSPADLLEKYLRGKGLWQSREIESGWFAVAGPCSAAVCRLSNLALTIDPEKVQERLSFIPRLGWGNDLVALAHGLPYLPKEALLPLNGEEVPGPYIGDSALNKAVLAPGTGLGESIIIEGEVHPTEGGHADFAPACEEDLGLWLYLHRLYGHVSYERVLSGPGLVNIYNYLVSQTGQDGSASQAILSTTLPRASGSDNGGIVPGQLTPQEISAGGLAKTCPLCVRALNIFVRILGAEAGNLALKSLALGGVYLGGGIAPKIKDKLKDGIFRESFKAKGRFSQMLAGIPVYLVLEENTPLLGAAALAWRQLEQARQPGPKIK